MYKPSLLAIALLASAYFFGGLAIAALLRRECRNVSRLYMADLLGAGLGVVLTRAFDGVCVMFPRTPCKFSN